MDKYSSQLSYWVASLLAAAGAMTLQDWAVLVGTVSSETSQADTTNNQITQGASAKTELVTSSTSGSTLSDVKKAISGVQRSASELVGNIADKVSSAVEDVTKPLGEVTVSATQKLDAAVKQLARSLT